jgi:hypothetical protein
MKAKNRKKVLAARINWWENLPYTKLNEKVKSTNPGVGSAFTRPGSNTK